MKWDADEVNGTAMGVVNGIKETPGSLTQAHLFGRHSGDLLNPTTPNA